LTSDLQQTPTQTVASRLQTPETDLIYAGVQALWPLWDIRLDVNNDYMEV